MWHSFGSHFIIYCQPNRCLKGNYVFVKRYVTTGSSSSFYAGIGSASNAVKDGLEKALKQIKSLEKAKIKTTIEGL